VVKSILLKAIRYYQNTGGSVKHFAISCNFSPTCSHYTFQAIERFGVIKGIIIGLKRIRRCNDPDCVQVIQDPLPDKKCRRYYD
jgi:putative membrane protein insertion efficiency factor